MTGFLTNLPIIIVAILVGFAGVLIIDAEKRQSKRSKKSESSHHKI